MIYKREKMVAICDFEYAKQGEILDISHHTNGFCINELAYIGEIQVMSIKCEILGNVFDYFITLAELREQQIKSVLDD